MTTIINAQRAIIIPSDFHEIEPKEGRRILKILINFNNDTVFTFDLESLRMQKQFTLLQGISLTNRTDLSAATAPSCIVNFNSRFSVHLGETGLPFCQVPVAYAGPIVGSINLDNGLSGPYNPDTEICFFNYPIQYARG